MRQTPLITGLTRSLARAGRLRSALPTGGPDKADHAHSHRPQWGGLLGLVVLADWLFWHQSPGLSLALFAVAVFAVASADIRPRLALWRPAVLLALAVAPVVEHVQVLSLAFLALGLVGALVWTRRPEMPLVEVMGRALAFLRRLPVRWTRPLMLRRGQVTQAVQELREQDVLRRLLRDWAFPVAGGVVLISLMMQANPVLARVLDLDIDLWTAVARVLFWTGAALFIAPFLARDLPVPVRPWGALVLPVERLGLHPASVLRALVLFNGVIGVQTVTDLSILTFGAVLPDGMSMAEYAHRGAYPLLAAALLAGAFALAARPFLGAHRAIRPLLLLWLVQNMALCGAAMLRLDHYIDAFGLTYLRLYAVIWMGLVAAGLGLVAVQVLRSRGNLWLMFRCGALGLATLYVCCFINFAQIIAAQNLARPRVDAAYVCNLGPMAHGALRSAIAARPDLRMGNPRGCAIFTPPIMRGWRDWGFRSWRVSRYAAASATKDRVQ